MSADNEIYTERNNVDNIFNRVDGSIRWELPLRTALVDERLIKQIASQY